MIDESLMARWLEEPALAASRLRSWGLEDVHRAHAELAGMARSGVTLDLLAGLAEQLESALPGTSDPAMALGNLERFVAASRSPLALAALFDRDRSALPILLRLFSISQHLSDLLIRDPDAYDLLRLTEGRPVSREALIGELQGEVERAAESRQAAAALRRFKHRETLRIAYGDVILGQSLEVVTRQISFLADAILDAAVRFARRVRESTWGVPTLEDGSRARYAVLALGKLGGEELNYSSDVDLIPLYERDGETRGKRSVSNREFFERLTTDVVKLLGESTELGIAYRVDLRLRPEGIAGPVVQAFDFLRRHYENDGRTWERQAFVKARVVAGDHELGQALLERLEPWVYRRYLSRADISGIKALKRRIEARALGAGLDRRDVKSGLGGIRDIEFAIQFLQLLNGGDLPSVRVGSTLEAIAALADVGCLTLQERNLLERNYVFLRQVEHRLQILFDRKTHELPEDLGELRKLALRMGYRDLAIRPAVELFRQDLQERTEVDRRILDFLLHDAFGDEQSHPEADLILDPEPAESEVLAVLGRRRFEDPATAYQRLVDLGRERFPFLSTRRCRHFLASISAPLLDAIDGTPDPDRTLTMLGRVADSIGGKGTLWELFSYHRPSLELMVRLCASGDYLTDLLTNQSGMLDELLDSLLVERPPTPESLEESLAELCRGAEDPGPILASFKASQHLRIGIRDILGKTPIEKTQNALSDVAEALMRRVVAIERGGLVERYGEPEVSGEESDEPHVLALGKLGGREPNYHSDLDVVFLYDQEGTTRHRRADRATTHAHFYTQWATRIVNRIDRVGPNGRLYEMDARLRPTGRSGILAQSLLEFERYFRAGEGAIWERLAVLKARPILGSVTRRQRVLERVHQAVFSKSWQPEFASEIAAMRQRLQETASAENLKRGLGGTMDVEFSVQTLQLRYGGERPEIVVPGTLDGLARLAAAGLMDAAEAEEAAESYRWLRLVESRLRLMNTAARHDLPQDERAIARLSYLLEPLIGVAEARAGAWMERIEHMRIENRRRFTRLFDRLSRGG